VLTPLRSSLKTEAAVLRPPALGNVELRQNLDARYHLAHAPVERLLQRTERWLAKHTIDAESHVQPGRQHFDVNVAAPVLDGLRQHLLEQFVGPLADLFVGNLRLQLRDVRARARRCPWRLRLGRWRRRTLVLIHPLQSALNAVGR
jgi:hypothetical protein